jgi:hypothetical protein
MSASASVLPNSAERIKSGMTRRVNALVDFSNAWTSKLTKDSDVGTGTPQLAVANTRCMNAQKANTLTSTLVNAIASPKTAMRLVLETLQRQKSFGTKPAAHASANGSTLQTTLCSST